MEDQELLTKLGEIENKQWTNKVRAEVMGQEKQEYEYQIVFRTREEDFFDSVREFTSAGYFALPETSLFQKDRFIVLMRRVKGK